MSTFVSMITWSGDTRPRPVEIRAAVDARFTELRDGGFHSLVFLPDDRACTAVMVVSCDDDADVDRITGGIWPDRDVEIESMRFDDDVPAWIGHETPEPPPPDYLTAVLEAVVSA